MPKKRSVKSMKAECDKLFSLIVRSRGECEAWGWVVSEKCVECDGTGGPASKYAVPYLDQSEPCSTCEGQGYITTTKPCKGGLQTSHIVSRKYNATRWDSANAECLCAKHHRMAHDFPALNGIRLLNFLGYDHLQDLHARAQVVTKLTHQDWLDLLQALKDKLERLAA